MKKYIKPSIRITNVEVETLLDSTSNTIQADSTPNDGPFYCPPSRDDISYSVWGTDEEED